MSWFVDRPIFDRIDDGWMAMTEQIRIGGSGPVDERVPEDIPDSTPRGPFGPQSVVHAVRAASG